MYLTGTINKGLIDSVPDLACSVRRRVFSSEAYKEKHLCKGSKDPQDMNSFSISEVNRLISSSAIEYIQRADSRHD